MMDLLKLLMRKKENSKDVAKERLKLVLIHDRSTFSPQFLEMVKGEIIKVIQKYMEVDEELLVETKTMIQRAVFGEAG